MSTERYLFLIKGSLVLAQPLAAQETGELLTSLLQQGFAVGPQPVWASNAEQALACYDLKTCRIPKFFNDGSENAIFFGNFVHHDISQVEHIR
ncbi:hypothetical protein, partial [Aeromonas taiwanensis]|uniref:hypothetical protein n=1 Tax=Aeromonas taiwanensis TaxID=633417 RepID=UPI00248DF64D